MPTLKLSGDRWKFRRANTDRWLPAIVPGCVHTDLRRAGQIPDPFVGTNELKLQWIEERDWDYRLRFSVPRAFLRDEVIELVADGLDTVAVLELNGHEFARSENMFVGARWDVRPFLKPGRNVLSIRFRSALGYIRKTRTDFSPPREFNDPVGNCVRIRKQPCQFGWDWGPRFVTAGIWRDLRLESWSGQRLVNARIAQQHAADGTVTLSVTPELARPRTSRLVTHEVTLSLAGRVVAESVQRGAQSIVFRVETPRLWWPSGQGEQPLYDLSVRSIDAAGVEVGVWKRRIGLRTIALDRHPDRWGESFQFVVNGRAVFLKGANWIPAHSFVAGLTRADYARDLRAAAAANMNSVRVWGGGIYESEDFYDLCDELGLLVWQDFMFACTLYPSDRAFLASVRAEAEYQVTRLRHRACLGLWCGNNEIAMCNSGPLTQQKWRRGYEKLFHQLLPGVVRALDGATSYWPSSEWRGAFPPNPTGAAFVSDHPAGESRGDTHFWDVWHSRHPVKDYEKWALRFCSEFGMQSYSSLGTQATFCPPGATNVFGPAMENHQKNRAGNQIILDYVSRRYRFPKSQDDLLLLSQLNQAYCMKTAVEHYRRSMPRCMGALYWQLNDCWPGASWSSIEFTGRWKALHHEARRFNAPFLVSAHVPGDEAPIIGNYRRSTVADVHLWTVCDAPQGAEALLRWALMDFDGRRVLGGRKLVKLRPNESRRQLTLKLGDVVAKRGRDQVYLRIALSVGGSTVSEDTVFLAPPRFLNLPRGRTAYAIKRLSPTEIRLTCQSSVFQHRVTVDFPGREFSIADNFFDLYPGETKMLSITFAQPISRREISSKLRLCSLVDTYT
jgi:beta-mannosidase